MLEEAGVDAQRGASMDRICEGLTGAKPRYMRMVGTGDVWKFHGEWIVRAHSALPDWRKIEVVGHELGHWRAKTTGRHFNSLLEQEAWCDAVGARLACPSPAFRRLVSKVGHRVHGIAEAFGVSQSMTLLRLGEVTGRPVLLLRQTQHIARGRDFGWPSRITPRTRTPLAHPVRVDDRWGFMASADAWLSAA